jgi:hypothetical protein
MMVKKIAILLVLCAVGATVPGAWAGEKTQADCKSVTSETEKVVSKSRSKKEDEVSKSGVATQQKK